MALAVSGANVDVNVNVNVCCTWRGEVGVILQDSGV